MIHNTTAGITHAKALLAAVADCGAQPPEVLTSLVDAYEELANIDTGTDPTAALIQAVAAGTLRGDTLDKRIAQACQEIQIREYRAGLRARTEAPVMQRFVTLLDQGAADDIITALAPEFDRHAQALASCAELVDPNTDLEQFVATASPDAVTAWRSIDDHVTALQRIGNVVCEFGPQSTSFPMVTLPTNLPGYGFSDNRGFMCIDPKYDTEAACQLFRAVIGTHRNSPWFKAAPMLKLNTIAEAREKMRAWSEKAWDTMNLSAGRGRMDPDHGFIAEPVANPFALEGANA